MRKILNYILLVLLLTSCGEYVRLQRSTDPEEKFQAGKNYFQEKKYAKCITMFEDIVPYYRGTPQAEELLYLLSESYMGQQDYYSASEYYQAYIRNFPRGTYAEEARYKVAYCYYLDSPDPRLDQVATYDAINAFSEFISLYPESSRIGECRKYLFEMEVKLAYKELLNAQLYYNLGLYGGNNYRACVTTAENALRDFPDASCKDDLVFVILKAKAKEASFSVEEKKKERYSEVVDEYYRYANEFPNGKHIKEANRILRDAKNKVDN
jgi:outer membrane protein assembly factor BamD